MQLDPLAERRLFCTQAVDRLQEIEMRAGADLDTVQRSAGERPKRLAGAAARVVCVEIAGVDDPERRVGPLDAAGCEVLGVEAVGYRRRQLRLERRERRAHRVPRLR